MADRVLILTGVLNVLHFSGFYIKDGLFYNSRKRSYTIKILIDMFIDSTVIESPLMSKEQIKLFVGGNIKKLK